LWFLLKTVVFLAVVAGIGYYAWLHRGRFIPPEATKEKDVDPEVPKAFKALFYDIKENPDRHLTNLAKLKAFDPKPLDEDSRIQFDHKIREIEERIEVEGAKLLESISGRVKEELRKKDFPAAMAAAEAFPAQLSSPKWREKTEELRVRVRRETSEELKAQLSALNEKVANGELEEVIKQGETLGLDRLQDLSPEETAQLKAVLQSAADTLSRRRKAQEVVRDTSMQLCRILADDRVFDAFDFAAKTLADPDWVRTVSDDSKGHILRQELEALRDLYANAVKFLEQQVGKEFEFRSRPAVIQSFKDGTIDLDLKGVRQYRERPISEVFTVSDIARLAEMSWDENEDEFLRKVAILYLLTDDVKEAERNFKKLPEEMSAPYREELKFHQFVQQLEEAMAFIPATKFLMGISQTVVDKTIESIRSTPEGELTNADWLRSEIPRREIELDAFFIDKYEVSNERYAGFLEFMQRTNDHSKCHPRETKDKDHTPKAWYDKNIGQSQRSLPVVGVDWFDAYAFAAWSGVRLPTEAEWECAASWNPKTGKKVEYPWLLKASKYHPRYARFARLEQGKLVVDTEDGYEHAKPVTSCPFGASPNGCRNMAGNVWEWIFDWHAPQYQLEEPLKNPKGAETGTARVVRGGSYMTVYYLGRTTARAPSDPLRREFDIGFRCAADPPSLLPVRLKRYGVMP
jgi:formylglycine-generating enzyme required for sulfatase activity